MQSPDASAASQIGGAYRQHLAEYAARYAAHGDSALLEYRDRDRPDRIAEELRLIYESKGLPQAEAAILSEQVMKDPAAAIDTLTREELGLNPAELTGSPNEAAFFSFILFSVGAAIPVAPFFVLSGVPAVVACITLSGLALFGCGAMISVFTGKPVLISGTRQLLLGGLAAGLTHILGRWIGASL